MKRGQNSFNPGLAGVIAKFANFLKANGFKIFQSSINDALISLKYINLLNRQDVFYALRANFAKTDMEWAHFYHLFNIFWKEYLTKEKQTANKQKQIPFIEDISPEEEETELTKEVQKAKNTYESRFEEQKSYQEGIGYSPVSHIEKKELTLLDDSDVNVAKLVLKQIAAPFKIQKTRRSKKGLRSGEKIDFPKMMRKSLKYEGYPVEFFFKEKKKRLKKLIILADVSGSMQRYASFVIPFLLSIKGISTKAEVFVFSTSLTRVTHIVKHLDIEDALKKIGEEVPNWAGGTRIGFSIKQFNCWNNGLLINKRAVVLILSDGWDLGSKELLRREMESLRSKVYSIIWLNPILNDPALSKMCKGMQVAMPYIDYILPANNLQELKKVGKLLTRLMVH